jgi:hypothetical protein
MFLLLCNKTVPKEQLGSEFRLKIISAEKDEAVLRRWGNSAHSEKHTAGGLFLQRRSKKAHPFNKTEIN